jgi:hypothetical protein
MTGSAVLDRFQVDDTDGIVRRERRYDPPPGDAYTTSEQYLSFEEKRAADLRFESEYRKLGWTRGRYASPQFLENSRAFWIRSGVEGAAWLAGRIRNEAHVDVLDHAANLLADIGSCSLSPVLVELQRSPTIEQAECLLTAIGWLPVSHDSSLSFVLVDLAKHPSVDVREACVVATRALFPTDAVPLLKSWFAREADAQIRDAIETEVAERSK